MPLNPATLLAAIRTRTDQADASFVGFPATVQEAGEAWARIATRYYREAVAPPLGLAATAAEAVFVASYAGLASSGAPGIGVAALDAAFVAYVGTAALGVTALVPGSVTTPPVGSPNLAAVLLAAPPTAATTAVLAGARLATVLDIWSRTGTYAASATLAPVPWS